MNVDNFQGEEENTQKTKAMNATEKVERGIESHQDVTPVIKRFQILIDGKKYTVETVKKLILTP